MSEIHRILDQMDRAFSGDAWHGPSLMSVLDGISAEDASKHPIRGAHSIWELVHHISSWSTISQHRLAGETLKSRRARLAARLGSQRDGVETRARRLVESRARLRDSVKGFQRRSSANRKPRGRTTRATWSCTACMQHDLYHAGQIVMLKKALAS